MPDQSIGKYLSVRLVPRPAARKTDVWLVVGTHGDTLGKVYWYGPWRQYVFEPGDATLYNSTCLRDIVAFLDRVNRAHRETP